jgi:hypothetical protein
LCGKRGEGLASLETWRRCSDGRGQVVERERETERPARIEVESQWTPNAESISQ